MKPNTAEFLQSILREIATVAAQGCAYATDPNQDENGNYKSGWTSDFARREVDEVWRDACAPLRKARGHRVSVSELRDMPKTELLALGFRSWDENLTVIPLWAFNYIADGETLIAIDGERVIKGQSELDLDVRMGCIAYGFHSVP